METTIVGTKVPRLDAPDKVTGKASYVADLYLPGMLHCHLKLSPHAHARIKNIDTSRAQTHPGVVAVITWNDVPDQMYGELVRDQRMFARDRVRFVGDVVAAVAAETLKAAKEAVDLISVE